MSKYLDFVGEKITKKEKKEGVIAVGTVIAATIAVKHFLKNKKEKLKESDYFQAEEEVNDEFKMELAGDFSYLDSPEPQLDPFSDLD